MSKKENSSTLCCVGDGESDSSFDSIDKNKDAYTVKMPDDTPIDKQPGENQTVSRQQSTKSRQEEEEETMATCILCICCMDFVEGITNC